MILFLFSLALTWASGFMVAECCLQSSRFALPAHLIHALATFLGIGIGFGLSSLWLFVWLLVLGTPGQAYVIVDAMLHALLIISLAIRIWRHRSDLPSYHRTHFANYIRRLATPQKIAVSLFIVLLIAAVVQEGYITLNLTHGGWDAMAIWNMRARHLYLSQALWRNAFDPAMAHTDYPLLMPLTVTRGWLYFGTDTQVVPALVGILFSFCSVGLLVTGLISLRGIYTGLVAGAALLSTPLFLTQSTYQTADVPLCFFILAALVLITVYFVNKGKLLLFLAGLCAGFAAWTKNEGLLFALITTGVVLVTQLRSLLPDIRERRAGGLSAIVARHRTVTHVLAYATGLLFVLCSIAIFKITLAPPNDLIANQNGLTLAKLLNPSRYLQIVDAASNEILKDYPWLIAVAVGLILGGLYKSARIWPVYIVLGAMVAGYFLTYVTTPMNLAWHLGSSLDRVMLQLWPSFLFASFYSMRLIN